MSNQKRKQLEKDFNRFTSRHFESPSRCKNLGQLQFYIKELTVKIGEFKSRFNYVPNDAYSLLSEYNASQNRLIFIDFQKTYSL